MGEKGTERQRGPNGVFSKRGHVRVIKNSNMSHGQVQGSQSLRSLAASPIKSDGKGCPSPDSFVSGGSASAKKGKRSVDFPSLCVSPTSRNGVLGGSSSPKNITPRSSPSLGCHYAGAKFSEPPSPDTLPKPPVHWAPMPLAPLPHGGRDQFFEISQQLKMMLKVQA